MRRRRILLLFLGFLALLVLSTWIVLRQTGATRTFVQRILQQFIRSEFALADANLDPASGTVHLVDVRIDHPAPGAEPVLRASNVELDVNTNPLGSGSIGEVRAVRLQGLTLDLTLDGSLDLDSVLDLPELEQGESTGDLPAIRIVDSTVKLRRTAGAQPVEFREVELELTPETESPSRVVLRGSMVSVGGYRVGIRGGGDVEAGTFRALLETEGVALTPKFAQPYSAEIANYLRDAGLDGLARKVTLWVEYDNRPANGDDAGAVPGLRAGANVEIADLTIDPPEVGTRIERASGRVTASTRNGGTIGIDVKAAMAGAGVEVRGVFTECTTASIPRIDARIEAEAVPINVALTKALSRLRITDRIRAALRPEGGTVGTSLHLFNDASGEQPDAELDLELHDVDLTFAGFANGDQPPDVSFPYPVKGASGSVQVRRGRVIVHDVAGKGEGNGTLTVNGEIKPRMDAPAGIDLQVTGASIPCTSRLRQALNALDPSITKIYDSYAPTGEFGFQVAVKRSVGERNPGIDVVIEPQGMAARFSDFPYPVRDLRGRIEIVDEDVAIDLTGRGETAEVRARGRIRRRAHKSLPGLELRFVGNDIPLDDTLRTALVRLAPQLGEIWDQYQPTGTAAANLTLWRDAGAREPSYDLRVDLRDSTVRAERLQRTLTAVRGPLFVHGDGANARVEISGIRGQLDNHNEGESAGVLVQGLAWIRPTGNSIDWTAVVRNLDLNDELATTLDRIDALKRPAWDVLRPSGTVDLVFHEIQESMDEDPTTTVQLQLIDVGSAAAFLPGPLSGVHGLVTIEDGRASLANLRGKILGKTIDCQSASVERANGETRFQATIAADSFPVDDRLANLMSGPMRETYLARRMRGHASVDDLEIEYRFPDDSDAFSLGFSGTFTTRDVALQLAAPIRNLSGTWRIEKGTRFTGAGGTLNGVAQGVGFTVLGHRVRNFTARVNADPSSVAFRDLGLTLHGGQVIGEPEDGVALRYEFGRKGRLSGHVRWRQLSLASLLRATGSNFGGDYRGAVSGRLQLLELSGDDLIRMRADGELQIREGRLGEVPAFSAIYALLSPKKRPQFNGAAMKLAIADGKVTVSDLSVSSPVLQVVGKGSITMDGYLDMVLEFPDLFGSGADWLVLPQVVQAIGNQVVQFYVYGYARAPKAKPRWLWQGTPGRSPIEPIPSRPPQRAKKKF